MGWMKHLRSAEQTVKFDSVTEDSNVLGDWSLTVTGYIVRVDKEDVDKSGRHQKFFYEFLIRPESMEGWQGQACPPAVLAIRVKDMELHQLISEMLCVGDRVIMVARANGPSPSLLYLSAVKKLAGVKSG